LKLHLKVGVEIYSQYC